MNEEDRRRAKAMLNYGVDEQVSPMDAEYVDAIAAELAAERERAIEPFVVLADEMQRQIEFRREGDPVSLVADVREADLRWLRLAISNARDPR